jgi:glycosyltransferase involved in cell wall biosynthesis
MKSQMSCTLILFFLIQTFFTESLQQQPQQQLVGDKEYHDSRPSLLFMLSSLAISGGNISILQEAIEMKRKGMRVSIAVSNKHVPEDYVNLIMALSSAITAQGVKDMIIIYDGNCCWPKAPSAKLIKLASSFDVVVATYHTTAIALKDIVNAHPHVMPAYYVQDYEPWFTCNPFECPFRNKLTFYNRLFNKPLVTKETHFKYTVSTYSADVYLFAKTNWIKNMVENNHKDTHVHMVVPSIDHTVYYAEPDMLNAKAKVARILPLTTKTTTTRHAVHDGKVGRIRVIAMLRPRTPRRNSMTCLDTLLKLAYDFPSLVQVSFFGVDRSQLAALLSTLVEQRGVARHRSSSSSSSKQVKVLGLLKQRHDLASLYRSSDLFVDMSWWQAFGRTAVEAMACGCVPIMPSVGAGRDVCEGGRVCQYHDGTDVAGFYDVIVSLVQNHTERLRMVEAGMARARQYSIRLAAASIEASLTQGVAEYRDRRSKGKS